MKQYRFKNLIYIIPILFLFFSFLYYVIDQSIKKTFSSEENNVVIKNTSVTVMIADDHQEQWQGLSDRASMGAYNGMLFVFPKKQARTFVMRNMGFPLDIIWINDNKIVKIDERLEPEGNKPTERYSSPGPVNYVLEINGGFSDAFGFEVGDIVDFNYEK